MNIWWVQKGFLGQGKGSLTFSKKKKCLASNLQNPLDFENLAYKDAKLMF